MTNRIAKFRQLNARQRRVLLPAFARLVRAQWQLRFASPAWFRQTMLRQRKALQNMDVPADKALALQLADDWHEAVRLAARCVPGAPACLARSLVLVDLLQRRQVPARVCLGVAQKIAVPAEQFASHAWVEVAGQMIAEPESVAGNFAQLSID